jgi:four helix bundle protein
MTPQELKARTKKFAKDIVRLCRRLPFRWDVREMAGQLLRAGTAVAANYRSACRARSDKEFCSRIAIVLEEADESQLWLELLGVPELEINPELLKPLFNEATELTAIFNASYETSKSNLEKRKREKKQARENKKGRT